MERAERRMIRVRWENNNSKQYDQRVQDIDRRFVWEDFTTLAIGSVVHISWGKQSRIWTAVMVDLLEPSEPGSPPAPPPGNAPVSSALSKTPADSTPSAAPVGSSDTAPAPRNTRAKRKGKGKGKHKLTLSVAVAYHISLPLVEPENPTKRGG